MRYSVDTPNAEVHRRGAELIGKYDTLPEIATLRETQMVWTCRESKRNHGKTPSCRVKLVVKDHKEDRVWMKQKKGRLRLNVMWWKPKDRVPWRKHVTRVGSVASMALNSTGFLSIILYQKQAT